MFVTETRSPRLNLNLWREWAIDKPEVDQEHPHEFLRLMAGAGVVEFNAVTTDWRMVLLPIICDLTDRSRRESLL